MTDFDPCTWLRASTLEELKENGVLRVKGSKPALSVFYHDGNVSAVDNRCPHLGFPLHRGTVKDGVLTCHWHHANFDLLSGCSYTRFADDVPTYDTHVEDGVVYVSHEPRRKLSRDDQVRRLNRGLEQNVSVVIAKSVDHLLKIDPSGQVAVRETALYGSRRHGLAVGGMTNLSIAASLLPYLDRQTAFFALYKAVRAVAGNCAGKSPRMLSEPLDTDEHSLDTLTCWFRRWIETGQVTGAERVILTVARSRASIPQISNLFFSAATDQMYVYNGVGLALSNKGFELIEFLGREYAGDILPLVVRWAMAKGGGAEDQSAWSHPVDLVTPLREAERRIEEWMAQGRGRTWSDDGSLTDILLGDDPHLIIDRLGGALKEGASAMQLTRYVAYAAARRLAHFSLTNELQDWQAPQRTFCYAHAMHRAAGRGTPGPEVMRGIFHGSMAVYMDRFLNVPAVRLPGERRKLDDLPSEPQALRKLLLQQLDQQSMVEPAARVLARYVRLGHPLKPLFDTLTLATVREDLGHPYWQMLEAGIGQAREWEDRPEAEHILVGVVRHLAAVCPTPRANIKPAQMGLRLNQGERIYEDEPERVESASPQG